MLGGRLLYRHVISAVRDLWSAICVAASTLGHLYLENVPFAIFLPLYGLYLLSAYSFLCMVSVTFLVAYFMPTYRQYLISSFKRTCSILRTLIQFQYRGILNYLVRQEVEAGGAVTAVLLQSHLATSWFESKFDDAPDGMMIGSMDLEMPLQIGAGSIVLADGRILTGHYDGSLQISDLHTQEKIVFQAHPFSVDSILQLRDGRVVSQSNMMSIYMKVWDINTLTCIKRINTYYSGYLIFSFQELNDGTLLQLVQDALISISISIWDLESGTCVSRFELGEEYGTPPCNWEVLQLRSGDEQLLCCWGWRINTLTILTTSRPSAEERCRLVGHSAGVFCVLELENGRLMSGSLDHTVKVWDIPSGSCLATLDHTSAVLYLAPLHGSSSQRIVSGCEDGTLRIWDTTTYSCLSMHSTETLEYGRIISLSDGRFLCAHANSLSLWSLDSSEQKYVSSTFPGKAIDFNHDSYRVSSCIQQQVHGRPFYPERVLIYTYIPRNRDHTRGIVPEIVPERISLWSFPSVQKRRWIRRRGFLLLVHCSYRAVLSDDNSLASSPAFQKLIRIHSLVVMIAKLL